MSKILLVEDNEMNRDMLSRRLLRCGYEVVTAVDHGEGITLARSKAPDLILLDVSLPVPDREAARQLKNAPETSAIPVIVLTAHAATGNCEEALHAGGEDYDTKPIELSRLLEKITALLTKA